MELRTRFGLIWMGVWMLLPSWVCAANHINPRIVSNSSIQADESQFVEPPFALFVTVDLSHKIIDDILSDSYEWAELNQWYFFLVNRDYRQALRKKPDRTSQNGTMAPIAPNYHSDFLGSNAREMGAWLRGKPSHIDLDDRFFAVLDAKALEDKVVLCRIGDSERRGDAVTCVLEDTALSALTLAGLEYGDFDDLIRAQGPYTPSLQRVPTATSVETS